VAKKQTATSRSQDRHQQTEITVDNMLDNLLYANSKNLAHFQEKIMDFVRSCLMSVC